MAIDWEAIGKDFNETFGAFKGRWNRNTTKMDLDEAGKKIYKDNKADYDKLYNADRSKMSGATRAHMASLPDGLDAVNHQSAIGTTHGFLSRSIQAMGMKSEVGASITAGAGMAAVGLGAASGVSNLSYNHPVAGGILGGVGVAGLVAGAIDPAALGTMYRSGIKDGVKNVGAKIGKKTAAPGAKQLTLDF